MNQDQLVTATMHRTGIERRDDAARALDATLRTLGERLPPTAANLLAEELPDASVRSLRRGRFDSEFPLDELYRRVSRREKVPLGFALEHAQAICQLIAERMNPGSLDHLRSLLSPGMCELFSPRRPSAPPPYVHHPPTAEPRRRTLSEGVPGTSRPISETPFDGAHAGSVLSSPNPHSDTKISSARGFTQERHGDTIATGHPRPLHPLDEGKD